MAIVWALVCGFIFGFADLLTRLGVRSGTPFTGATVTTLTIFVFFSIAVLARGLGAGPLWPAVGWFLLMGIASMGPGRILYYFSVRRIGVSRASVLLITAPLVGILFAVAFLGERPSWLVVAGAFCVVGGIMGVVTDRAGIRIALPDALLGLLPMVFLSLTPIFIRLGMQSLPDPFLGTMVSSLGALAFLWMTKPAIPPSDRWAADRPALRCFLLAGLLYGLAFFTFYKALGIETVSFVTPLVYTSPLFSILFSRLLFQQLEQVTWRLIAGAAVVFLGVALVSLSRGG